MDAMRGTTGVVGGPTVQERGARQQKGNAEAFRRALQQEGTAGQPQQPPQQPPAPPPARDGQPPLRPPLQPRLPGVRKDGTATAQHVDVLA